MNTTTLHTISTARMVFLIAVLTVMVAAGSGTAGASCDAGIRYPVLIGSGYEGPHAADSCDEAVTGGDLYDAILAGSGYEGQVTVAERDTASASESRYDSVLAGSGYEGHAGETIAADSARSR